MTGLKTYTLLGAPTASRTSPPARDSSAGTGAPASRLRVDWDERNAERRSSEELLADRRLFRSGNDAIEAETWLPDSRSSCSDRNCNGQRFRHL